jgi:DNA-damage-inducible protein D
MMSDDAPSRISPFEQIRQTADDGSAYWSARDLAKVLGYTNWRNFRGAVQRAILACQNSGQDAANHFDTTINMVKVGSGARR